ncbi:DUF1707 domain-containing protein [Pseudonocardia sp. KRD-169]|uniref:DUF1707 domain-containing protein n=1 Tax=Pseudonocardia abyssalis TaxID=2792008 RepID=A0ABS6UYH5_9PSEU|nr:DUF1707 domain-containing protein [Pseudonocardia abyssalis]MBW0137314.1 DUF1707 domain-containing protein [Pseudonocardia abyssalis]
MRASDADRSAVAQRLQFAVDEGRLDLSDYDERLRDAYAARTYGELEKLTSDLPAPTPAVPAVTDRLAVEKAEWRDEWRSWGGTAIVLVTIWGITSLATGSLIFFWPMFPIGIWGAILLASALGGRSHGST